MAFLEVAAIRRRVVGLMAICITTAGGLMKIAAASFVLSWTHSVEKNSLAGTLVGHGSGAGAHRGAHQGGSGAGMEPPEDAVLRNGWYSTATIRTSRREEISSSLRPARRVAAGPCAPARPVPTWARRRKQSRSISGRVTKTR
ncbi:DUF1850 domain-containing protein [Ochrobactrum intermedium]|nr:DUF1850 domain-containing protein [Brucella intermedia]